MEFGPKNRPVLMIEGTPMGCRLVPHRTDDQLLVLKAPPGMAEGLAAHMNIIHETLSSGEGRGGWHSVAVHKEAFLASLPEFLKEVLASNHPTSETSVAVKSSPVLHLSLVTPDGDAPVDEDDLHQ